MSSINLSMSYLLQIVFWMCLFSHRGILFYATARRWGIVFLMHLSELKVCWGLIVKLQQTEQVTNDWKRYSSFSIINIYMNFMDSMENIASTFRWSFLSVWSAMLLAQFDLPPLGQCLTGRITNMDTTWQNPESIDGTPNIPDFWDVHRDFLTANTLLFKIQYYPFLTILSTP